MCIRDRNKANTELGEHQQKMLDDMKEMFSQFYSRLTDLENNQSTLKEIPTATSEDIKKLFQVEDNTLIIGNPDENKSVVGLDLSLIHICKWIRTSFIVTRRHDGTRSRS